MEIIILSQNIHVVALNFNLFWKKKVQPHTHTHTLAAISEITIQQHKNICVVAVVDHYYTEQSIRQARGLSRKMIALSHGKLVNNALICSI